MNILELTGMKSTKYGGVESYFAESVSYTHLTLPTIYSV